MGQLHLRQFTLQSHYPTIPVMWILLACPSLKALPVSHLRSITTQTFVFIFEQFRYLFEWTSYWSTEKSICILTVLILCIGVSLMEGKLFYDMITMIFLQTNKWFLWYSSKQTSPSRNQRTFQWEHSSRSISSFHPLLIFYSFFFLLGLEVLHSHRLAKQQQLRQTISSTQKSTV